MANYFRIVVILLFPLSMWSQQEALFSHSAYAEKIYLQLDSDVYSANETIWFKAIVTSTVDNKPSVLSGILRVELINNSEEVIDKKIIKLNNGIGSGFFDLSKNYLEGSYLIRAYTEWNRNFDSDFIFEKYIQIFNPDKTHYFDPITKVNLEIRDDNTKWLKATIEPKLIDSLHKNKSTFYITSGQQKDSLIVKKNKSEEFIVEYPLQESSNFVTLQIRTKNKLSSPKTIVVNQDYIDLQFFPESGDLVHGISSSVGFKAVDANGKGKLLEGIIVNDNGETLARFKSNKLGMGKLVLKKVDSTQKYYAQVESLTEKELLLKYPLPKVKKQGTVLSIRRNSDKVKVKISSNEIKSDSIVLRVSSRGRNYYRVHGKFAVGNLQFELPRERLPEGVIEFTLLDQLEKPLVSRLFYNHKPENRINISLNTDKNNYEQREKTNIEMLSKNEQGEVIPSNMSLLVINKKEKGELQNLRGNIVSYFLLSSDIKGTIENPGHYFENDEVQFHDLDVLLLTQGWSRYNYEHPLEDKYHFKAEKSLQVSGRVSATFSKKKMKKAELTLMTFGKEKTFQSQFSDSLGRFAFDLPETYAQHLRILLQSKNKSGKSKNYTVMLDKMVSPDLDFNQEQTIFEVDSIVQFLAEKNFERNRIDEMFEMSSDVNQLDEAVVTGYAMTPQRTKVMEEYGEPDVVISGKKIQEKEKKWSYGLYSVLLFNFPDKVNIVRKKGILMAELYNAEPTLVVIDGIPVLNYNYGHIPSIPPSEVKSFEIIEYAKNFPSLYQEVFPQASPLGIPPWGNVIAIYTHAGKGLFGVQKPVGLVHASVPVFSPTREFYKPKYENLSPSDWLKPDLRALVHWEPTVSIDSLGTASTSFYNSDNVGETMIVVEAISENGEVGYKEFIYNVEKKENKK